MHPIAKIKKAAHIFAYAGYRRAFCKGAAAGVEHEAMLRILGPDTVVDIGANRGQFALAVRRCAPGARIIAFEPLDGPAKVFRRVFADDSRVILHPVAVAPDCGHKEMHVSERDDSSSLLPITELQNQLFPGTAEATTHLITTAPLHQHVAAADLCGTALLKIDVQGFEMKVLEGCESLLPQFSNIYAECSFVELYAGQKFAADIIAFLATHKFALAGVFNVAYDSHGAAIQADFLFARMEQT
jgi:FkbM family methyltransferase